MNTTNTTITDLATAVKQILNQNTLNDLKRSIKRRERINDFNIVLIYLFHIIQTAGILTTTVAVGYNKTEIIWIGIGFNFCASVIHILEKVNSSISTQLLHDIKNIKDGNFTDESHIEVEVGGGGGGGGTGAMEASERSAIPTNIPTPPVGLVNSDWHEHTTTGGGGSGAGTTDISDNSMSV